MSDTYLHNVANHIAAQHEKFDVENHTIGGTPILSVGFWKCPITFQIMHGAEGVVLVNAFVPNEDPSKGDEEVPFELKSTESLDEFVARLMAWAKEEKWI